MPDTDRPSDNKGAKHHLAMAIEIRRNRRFVWAMTGLLLLVIVVIALYAFYFGRGATPMQNQKRKAVGQTTSVLSVVHSADMQGSLAQVSLQPAPAPEPGSVAANDIDAPPAAINPVNATAAVPGNTPAAQLQGAAQVTDTVVNAPKKALDTVCQILGATCTQ